jgi:hypothetical protein
MNAVGRADIIRAGRNQPVFNSVVTKIAFLSNAFMRVKVDGLIRAGFDTCLATGTQIVIHYHDPIGSLAYGRFGASVDAGGLIAMPAYLDMENKI